MRQDGLFINFEFYHLLFIIFKFISTEYLKICHFSNVGIWKPVHFTQFGWNGMQAQNVIWGTQVLKLIVKVNKKNKKRKQSFVFRIKHTEMYIVMKWFIFRIKHTKLYIVMKRKQ